MKFTKMQGLGNDYVYINCMEEQIEDVADLARKLSDRHYGIGSDGVILIQSSDHADFCMNMYNADGSQAEMCGNGIRCVGKYVYDYGLTNQTRVSIETLAGVKYLDLKVTDGRVSEVTVNMGSPILEPASVPVVSDQNPVINEPIEANGEVYYMTCVSMGNPHAVIFVENTETFPLEIIGPILESHPVFPKKANIEFVQVLDDGQVNMRVWERGTGETLACGTGACAVAMACILNGKTKKEVIVHLLGGDLKILYDEKENVIYMTGPAVTVFDGVINE